MGYSDTSYGSGRAVAGHSTYFKVVAPFDYSDFADETGVNIPVAMPDIASDELVQIVAYEVGITESFALDAPGGDELLSAEDYTLTCRVGDKDFGVESAHESSGVQAPTANSGVLPSWSGVAAVGFTAFVRMLADDGETATQPLSGSGALTIYFQKLALSSILEA